MVTAEQKAIEMFNKALGELIWNEKKEVNKLQAKETVLNQLMFIKESLINVLILDEVPQSYIRKTQAYYNKIEETINKL